MNKEEQTEELQLSPAAESNADDSFFNQARKIEQDMHAIMARQLKLAVVQVVLAIMSIVVAFVLASLG